MMTDLEISKALALAIGWGRVQISGEHVLVYTGNPYDKVRYSRSHNWVYNNRVFDYKDWSVIGPIAKQYNMFPYCTGGKWWIVAGTGCPAAETPQKAIALAVIGAKK
jgi:phage protein U